MTTLSKAVAEPSPWHKPCLPFFFQLPLSSPQSFIFSSQQHNTVACLSFLTCLLVISLTVPCLYRFEKRGTMSSPFGSKLSGAPSSLPSSAQKAVRNFDIAQVSSRRSSACLFVHSDRECSLYLLSLGVSKPARPARPRKSPLRTAAASSRSQRKKCTQRQPRRLGYHPSDL